MNTMRQLSEEETRNRATLQAFQAAWGARDVAALSGLITDDCVYSASVGPEPGTTWRGRDEVIAGFALMLANDPGGSSSLETIYVGDKAFATWSIEAARPGGTTQTIRGSDVFDFKDGLIARKDAFRKVEANLTPALTSALTSASSLSPAPPSKRSRDYVVRAFGEADVPQLLQLMRALAAFEGYLDDFTVSEADLIDFGLSAAPRFEALVAANDGTDAAPRLLGMCVLYQTPWTYDMKPKLVMKELFVDEAARGRGVGQALLSAAQARAQELGASALIWTVLKGNAAAEAFYAGNGGKPDPLWNNWVLPTKSN